MKPLIKLKTTTLLVIPLVLAGFALLPRAQAETISTISTISPLAGAELAGFNTELGFAALNNLAGGTFNSAFGALTLVDNTSGSHNTALGAQALRNNNGDFNTAVGENALVFNETGDQNMALGQGALANNVSGSNNTAMGFQALNANTASGNLGVGFQALRANTTATENVAIGSQALFASNGNGNTAVGDQTLLDNTSGSFNTGCGNGSAPNNQSGIWNVAIGAAALQNNVSGSFNTTVGTQAGFNLTGSGNVVIGQGVFGVAGESNHTRIKNISNTPQANFAFVTIGAGGLLGIQISSQRYKEDIKPMDKASEQIFALKPVTFRFKHEIDPDGSPQYGLIAEEVAKVNPYLVYRDEEGKVQSVRYDLVNAMLLNEFLKEHKKVEEQQASIAELKSTVALQQKGMEVLTAQLKEQATQIQRVSAQVELNKPAPSTVANK